MIIKIPGLEIIEPSIAEKILPSGSIFFISNSGSDNFNGTEQKPFKTLQGAVNYINENHIINSLITISFQQDIYERIILDNQRGLNLEFNNSIIECPNGTALTIRNSNPTIKNLTVKNIGNASVGCAFNFRADVTVNNLTIEAFTNQISSTSYARTICSGLTLSGNNTLTPINGINISEFSDFTSGAVKVNCPEYSGQLVLCTKRSIIKCTGAFSSDITPTGKRFTLSSQSALENQNNINLLTSMTAGTITANHFCLVT